MTYKEFRDLVLQHIDQFSVAGEHVPKEYNNQADTLIRIPSLANIALRNISTQSFPIEQTIRPSKETTLSVSDFGGGWTKVVMPTDFWKLNGISYLQGGELRRSVNFKFLTNRELLVKSAELPEMLISYSRYPRRVKGIDEELLDCEDAVAEIASLYVAAELVRSDDPYLYQALQNEYEDNLARMRKPITAQYVRVDDVYATPCLY